MKKTVRSVWLVIATAIVVAMISGCATTKGNLAPPKHLKVEETKPVLVMQGAFDGIKIVHRAAVYRGKQMKPLDWVNENVVEHGAELYFEADLEIDDSIKQVFIKRVINETESGWVSLKPLERKNSFRVKFPSDKGQKEFSLKFRFVRSDGKDQILSTKKLKCNFN